MFHVLQKRQQTVDDIADAVAVDDDDEGEEKLHIQDYK